MRHRLILAVGLAALPSIASLGMAQDPHEHTGLDPARIGTVHFATSCDPAAQPGFDRAVALNAGKKTAEAVAAFRAFLERWPRHDLAPEAQLEIARIARREKRFADALAEARVVAAKYADRPDPASRAALLAAEILRYDLADLPAAFDAYRAVLAR